MVTVGGVVLWSVVWNLVAILVAGESINLGDGVAATLQMGRKFRDKAAVVGKVRVLPPKPYIISNDCAGGAATRVSGSWGGGGIEVQVQRLLESTECDGC
jgi:hypothetical protein